MKDQELVNALRCCAKGECYRCGMRVDKQNCQENVLSVAADRIANQNTHILALQKEIEGLRAQLPRWIPVTERLPEKQGWYHVAIRDEKTQRIDVELDLYAVETAKNFGHSAGFCKDGRWDGREKVIAWMPLPEPPEVADHA